MSFNESPTAVLLSSCLKTSPQPNVSLVVLASDNNPCEDDHCSDNRRNKYKNLIQNDHGISERLVKSEACASTIDIIAKQNNFLQVHQSHFQELNSALKIETRDEMESDSFSSVYSYDEHGNNESIDIFYECLTKKILLNEVNQVHSETPNLKMEDNQNEMEGVSNKFSESMISLHGISIDKYDHSIIALDRNNLKENDCSIMTLGATNLLRQNHHIKASCRNNLDEHNHSIKAFYTNKSDEHSHTMTNLSNHSFNTSSQSDTSGSAHNKTNKSDTLDQSNNIHSKRMKLNCKSNKNLLRKPMRLKKTRDQIEKSILKNHNCDNQNGSNNPVPDASSFASHNENSVQENCAAGITTHSEDIRATDKLQESNGAICVRLNYILVTNDCDGSGKTEMLFTVSGTLIALSHIYKCEGKELFYAKFFVDDVCTNPLMDESGREVNVERECFPLLVDGSEAQQWWPSMEIGQKYVVAKVKRLVTGQAPDEMGLLRTVPCSLISAAPDEAVSPLSLSEYFHELGWVTYEGRVSSVLDGALGVYTLDGGRTLLLLTALMGICTHLHPHLSPLLPGDEVVLHFPHVVRRPNGTLTLLCCTRTTIYNTTRPLPTRCDNAPKLPHSLDAVHRLRLPPTPARLRWLGTVSGRLTEAVTGLGGVMGTGRVRPLTRLLKVGFLRQQRRQQQQQQEDEEYPVWQPRDRNCGQEFMHHRRQPPRQHDCMATWGLEEKFQTPFALLTLPEVFEKEDVHMLNDQENSDSDNKDIYWHHLVTCLQDNNDSDAVLVCRLQLDDSGGLVAVFSDGMSKIPETHENMSNNVDFNSDGANNNIVDKQPLLENISVSQGIDGSGGSGDACYLNSEVDDASGGDTYTEVLPTSLPVVLCSEAGAEVAAATHLDSIVALFNPVLVREEFRVWDGRRSRESRGCFKRYLMVVVHDIMSFEATILKGCGTGSQMGHTVEETAHQLGEADRTAHQLRQADRTAHQLRQADRTAHLFGIAERDGSLMCRRTLIPLSDNVSSSSSQEDTLQAYTLHITLKSSQMTEVCFLSRQKSYDPLPHTNDLMFVCKATITKHSKPNPTVRALNDLRVTTSEYSNPKDGCRTVFIRFKGLQQALVFTSLSSLCRVKLRVPPSGCVALGRSVGHWWLQGLLKGGDEGSDGRVNSECIDFPASAKIDSISHTDVRDEISVLDALAGTSVRAECLLTVVGVVKLRYHMTPSFDSQNMTFGVKCDTANIGVPGCKNIRFVLEHCPVCDVGVGVATPDTVTVYWPLKNNRLIARYPLGLLPGAKVRLRLVSRNISKSGRAYLSMTPFSLMEVLDLPKDAAKSFVCEGDMESMKACWKLARHAFLHQIVESDNTLTSEETDDEFSANIYAEGDMVVDRGLGSVNPMEGSTLSQSSILYLKNPVASSTEKTFLPHSVVQVSATITRIHKVSLQLWCSSCHADVTSSGTCTYVGCHSRAPPELTCFVKVTVEDFLRRAVVVFKRPELVRMLLNIPSESWPGLTSVLVQHNAQVVYVPKRDTEDGYVNPATLVTGDNAKSNPASATLVAVLTEMLHNYCCSVQVYRRVSMLLRPLKTSWEYKTKNLMPALPCFYCLDMRKFDAEASLAALEKYFW